MIALVQHWGLISVYMVYHLAVAVAVEEIVLVVAI